MLKNFNVKDFNIIIIVFSIIMNTIGIIMLQMNVYQIAKRVEVLQKVVKPHLSEYSK